MTDLEKAVSSVMPLQDFWAVCRASFSGKSGHELRRVLASLSHPLSPQPGRDPYETYLLLGRAQVVGLLLKYSETEVTPATLISYEHRQSQGREAEGVNPAAAPETAGVSAGENPAGAAEDHSPGR